MKINPLLAKLFLLLPWVGPTWGLSEAPPQSDPVREILRRESASLKLHSRGKDNVRYLHPLINGVEAVAMLDTGADNLLISLSQAEKFGLQAGKTNVTFALPEAELSWTDMSVKVQNLPALNNASNDDDGPPVDLILGRNFFKRCPGIIDYGDEVYWVPKDGDTARDPLPLLKTFGWSQLVLEESEGVHYQTATGSVHGVRIRVMLDSGTGHSLFFEDAVEKYGVAVEDVGGTVYGLGKKHMGMKVGRVQALSLGDFNFDSYPVIVVDMKPIQNKAFGDLPIDAIIGAELLRAAGALYDASGAWIAWPNSHFDPLTHAKVNPLAGKQRKNLEANIAKADSILLLQIKEISMAQSSDQTQKASAIYTSKIVRCLKGELPQGASITLKKSIDLTPETAAELGRKYNGRGAYQIVLLGKTDRGDTLLLDEFEHAPDRFLLIEKILGK